MRERFLIDGLSGEKRLAGTLAIAGAKNAVLPAMAASLLFKEPLRIENVPAIEDVKRSIELLRKLGVSITQEEGTLILTTSNLTSEALDREISKRMRASIILTGPLLARLGKVSFPYPGGCVLGPRPIDLFLEGFKAMGCAITETQDGDDSLFSIAVSGKKLRGAELFFPIVSVTATETFMLAALLAEGTTVLKNAAMEPEITSVAEYLVSCGAKIKGIGTPTLTIEGGALLTPKAPYRTVPDRIETGSLLLLGALTAHDLELTGCVPEHVESLLAFLSRAGVVVERGSSTLALRKNTKPSSAWSGLSVKTHEYPGFPTDLQAPLVVFLTQVSGESSVFETIFDARFKYVDDLIKMGANITTWNSNRITVKGPTPLKDRELEGPDIRAGLAYVMAALVAKGTSSIDNIYYIDRGYERLETRLAALGASITRVAHD